MYRFLTPVLLAYFLALLQSTVISEFFPSFLKPDLMIIFITYLGTSPSLFFGASLAFFCGVLYDTFTGSPFGLFSLIYLNLFFLIKFLGKILLLGETILMRLSLVAMAMGCQFLFLFFYFWSGRFLETSPLSPLSLFLPQVLSTMAACWPISRLGHKYVYLGELKPLPPVAQK